MKQDLIRFSVAMPEDLLARFDTLVERRGTQNNRSEVIRDLVRDAIVEAEIEDPEMLVMGTLTIIYNHHANELTDKLHDIQHDYCENIISTTHVHMDPHTCLEVIIMKGENSTIHTISDRILGTKGVTQGKLTITAITKQGK